MTTAKQDTGLASPPSASILLAATALSRNIASLRAPAAANRCAINHKMAPSVKLILGFALILLSSSLVLTPASAQADQLSNDYTLWQQLLQPEAEASFDTYASFILSHPEWPNIPVLKKVAEERASPSARLTLQYFNQHPPQSITALNAYVSQLRRNDNTSRTRQAIKTAWLDGLPTEEDQSSFIATYSQHLTQADIFSRADKLLWARKASLAKKLLPLLDPQHRSLIKARISLQETDDNVNALIAKVPSNLKSNPGLVYDRVRWRNRHDLPASAAKLLHQFPRVAHGNPREWWRQRDDLARWALEHGKPEMAYDIASQHGFSTSDRYQYTEAEWLAGWIALRALNEPATAFRHFSNMSKSSSAAISVARYTYWSGRALQAQGKTEQARTLYKTAAQYGTTFYGQIAALDRYGAVQIALPNNTPVSQTARQRFQERELVQLVKLTHAKREPDFTQKFFLALLETLTSQEEATLAAELATSLDRRDLAVWAGKISGKLGYVVGRDSYPLLRGNIPTRPDKAYIHAIVRQESSFDPKAYSPAGAMGLMQLMPATATQTARQMGITTSTNKLLNDPMHNVILGSYLLNRLLERYVDSLVLAAIGYNAGPGRVNEWTDRFGDPRSPSPPVAQRMKAHTSREPRHWIAIDVIESYPFSETRFYIQQVLANAEIYRAVLNGETPTRLGIGKALYGGG